MKIISSNFDAALATVRELSENATLRPAPRRLRWVPLQAFALTPQPVWKYNRDQLLKT